MAAPRIVRLAIMFLCMTAGAFAQDDEVCAVGDNSPACRGESRASATSASRHEPSSRLPMSAEPPASDDAKAKVQKKELSAKQKEHSAKPSSSRIPVSSHSKQQADLITQEIQELETEIESNKERVELLKKLKVVLNSGHDLGLPAAHIEALRQNTPLVSQVVTDLDKVPTAIAEDYLVSKAVIPVEKFRFVKFIQLRAARHGGSSGPNLTPLPTALLAAVKEDGNVLIFTPVGEMVLSFLAGHDQPITHVATPPSQEEFMIATCDAGGTMRMHKVNVRQRRLSRDEKQARKISNDEKVSLYLGSLLNVTVQLQKEMQLPGNADGDVPRVTSLALISQGSSKYLIAGDELGKITLFTRNGTVRASMDTNAGSGAVVDQIQAMHGNVIFRAGSEWGFIDLEKMRVRHVECPLFPGRVKYVALDSQQATRVIATDEDGNIWMLAAPNKKDCRIELRFPEGTTQGLSELATIRGFAVGINFAEGAGDGNVDLFAVNITQTSTKGRVSAKTEPQTSLPAPVRTPIVWRRTRPVPKAWALLKRQKEGDLLAFLSDDGREIEIMELLMSVYAPPPTDTLGNFKMPVLAIAVVLVLGYQYMKQKGGGRLGKIGGNKSKFDFGDDFAKFRKASGGAAGGAGFSKKIS